MNVISGKVVLKETGVGIPDLLVVVYDVDPGTSPEETLAPAAPAAVGTAATASSASDGDRLGSRLTDTNGAFELTYDDAEFQVRNAKERRPDLLLSVLAPDEPGATRESRTLFSSRDVVQNAGRTEQTRICIPAAVLTKAGLPLPVDPSAAPAQAQTVIGKMRQAVDAQAAVTKEALSIAAQQVTAVRTNAKQLDELVEARVVESLTGMTATEADKLNVVLPGAKPEPMVWRTVNRTIADVVNTSTKAGYVVLSNTEAQQFRDSNGNYRDPIPAAEIEPYIFQADDTKRPNSIVRADPLAALTRTNAAPDPLATNGAVTTTDGSGNGANGQPADQPITSQDLPKFIGRLVAPIVAPEDSAIVQQTRPTAGDVQETVQSLTLGAGPADVTAFYDFHQLQIAFDYVWQHAVDQGVIDTTQTLAQQLAAQGGDPTSALQSGVDPFKALRGEVRHVTTAQQSLQAAGVSARMTANPSPLGAFGGVRPPIVRPPFNSGTMAPLDPAPKDLLTELDDMLSERYRFQVFAPGSTNFGLLVTYRQQWTPVTYQVGNLAKTLTLAPKETRKVTSKRTVKRERSIKELQDNQRNRKDETSDTMRDEAEIVARAQQKTSFSLTAKGSFDIGIADGDSTTSLSRDADASSQETKKQFHEAVLKAAQEFKDERKTEVETKKSVETETTDTAELTNPNDELTVTYLFYELQRRYRVSEHIHRLTPVVLVAMDVPNPNRDEIDKVLLAHSWIINRVLLDDRYRAPLEYLCTRIVGDEMALQHLAANVDQVAQAVKDLQTLHRDMELQVKAREAALQAAMDARAADIGKTDSRGALGTAEDWLFGSSSSDDAQAAQVFEDAAKDAYERSVQEEKDLRMRLDAETAALSAATEAYAKARAEHGNRLLQIAGLRAHFKENVLYYMQAIWNFTFRDQIFFSLCNVKVPKITATQRTYSLKVPDHVPLSITPRPGQVVLEVDAHVTLTSTLDPAQDFVTLAEVADLDNPLGYKGNYMIFPLRESNPLTDFMMVPYLDSELGIHDPDDLGSWTPEDFAQYAKSLLANQKDQLSPSDYAALQSQLEAQYKSIVTNPRVTNDVVVVPTSSLYIEALPGTHPLLENFKLEHRAVDVQKAQAEVRKLEMENLRYAARLLGDQLADPEIDKKILVAGGASVVVPPDA